MTSGIVNALILKTSKPSPRRITVASGSPAISPHILTGIPVVRKFQAFNQVSAKNDYQYGFSMVFSNQADYATYNDHPDHVAFVRDRWLKEVTDFLEIDFQTTG